MQRLPVEDRKISDARHRALSGLNKLPALSASAMRLLGRLSLRNCDLSELSALVEKDPLLSGQVVRSANSAAFLRLREIESVRHAIVMVGVGAIRKFVLAQSITNLFRHRTHAIAFSMTRFCLHSVAVGTLLELLSEELPLEFGEGAFLAGLFHDIGALLIACEFPQEYENVLELRALTDHSQDQCERSILGVDHAELSAGAIATWGLPEPLRACAAQHHHSEPATLEPAPPAEVSLSLALNKADEVADALGMSIEEPRPVPGGVPEVHFEGFEFDRERWLARFAQEWVNTDAMLR